MLTGLLRLALACGVGLVLLALLPFMLPESLLRRSLASWAETQWQRPLEMERLRLQLLPMPSVRAEQIRLGNPPGLGDDAEPFVRVARVRADFSWFQLISERSLVPHVLHLTEPRFHLLEPAEGAPNWQFARAARAPSIRRAALASSAAPRRMRVHMERARVRYQRADAPPRRLRLETLSARLTRTPDGLDVLLHPMRLYAGELSLHASMRQTPQKPAQWQGAFRWSRVSLAPLVADWGLAAIAGRVSGRMDFTSAGRDWTSFGRAFRADGDVQLSEGALVGINLDRPWNRPGLATVLALSSREGNRFSIAQTPFQIREGRLRIDALRFSNAEGLALLGEGEYRFADQQWRFLLRLPDSPDALVLGGTPQRPKLSWQAEESLEHLRDRAAQDVLNQLVDELF